MLHLSIYTYPFINILKQQLLCVAVVEDVDTISTYTIFRINITTITRTLITFVFFTYQNI